MQLYKISSFLFYLTFFFILFSHRKCLSLSALDNTCVQGAGRTPGTIPNRLTAVEVQRFGIWMSAVAVFVELNDNGVPYNREGMMNLIPNLGYFNFIRATNCDPGLFAELNSERRRLQQIKVNQSSLGYRNLLLSRLDQSFNTIREQCKFQITNYNRGISSITRISSK